jgi:hypothetical protein
MTSAILPSSVDVSKHVHNTEDTSYGCVVEQGAAKP